MNAAAVVGPPTQSPGSMMDSPQSGTGMPCAEYSPIRNGLISVRAKPQPASLPTSLPDRTETIPRADSNGDSNTDERGAEQTHSAGLESQGHSHPIHRHASADKEEVRGQLPMCAWVASSGTRNINRVQDRAVRSAPHRSSAPIAAVRRG